MIAPQDFATATRNLGKLAGTTIECNLHRRHFQRPWNGRGEFRSWQQDSNLFVHGPKTDWGAQFYAECKRAEIDENQVEVQIVSRLDNDGLALLIFFYIFSFIVTVGLGVSGNLQQIPLAWLVLGAWYLLQMQFLRSNVEEIYTFVADWLMENDRLLPGKP